MIRHSIFIGIFIIVTALPANAENLWLVIGASDSSATEIATKAKPHLARNPHSLIIQTNDCGDSETYSPGQQKLQPQLTPRRMHSLGYGRR